jgi:hypothetical protein
MIDFSEHGYLSEGNGRQRRVHRLIGELRIMERLAFYEPVVAGTIPIDIDVESSDVDILCRCEHPGRFEEDVRAHFSWTEQFEVRGPALGKNDRVVARFLYGDECFELFGQPIPVRRQHGFVHMVVEYRILRMTDARFRDAVRALKESGVSTEQAFARLMGIQADPYETLYSFGKLNDRKLRRKIPRDCRTR